MKLVTIATFRETAPASLAQNQLQLAGINAYLADAGILNTDWLINNALGGIKLQVANDDEQRARELLDIDTNPAGRIDQEHELIPLAGDDRDDEPETLPNEREQLAERIFRGANASILIPPLAIMILWYINKYNRTSMPVNQQARNYFFWGTMIASFWPFVMVLILLLVLLNEVAKRVVI